MRKLLQEGSERKLKSHEESIHWVFTPTYDFSSFLYSEVVEIKKHQPLEEYVRAQLVEEREHIFRKAREADFRYNRDVLAIANDGSEFRRFYGLEDALRQMLYGDCKLGYTYRETEIYSEGKTWTLKWIPKAERIYVPEDIKYEEEYLEYIISNNIVKGIELSWYDGNKDSNIKTENFIKGEKEYFPFIEKNKGYRKAYDKRKEEESSKSEEDRRTGE